MRNLSLQFAGVQNASLLTGVMVLLAVVLAAWGGYQAFRRRWRRAISGLGATAAPLGGHLALGAPGGGAAGMVLLGVQIVLGVGLFYGDVYAWLGRRRIAWLMLLRCAAIFALLMILFRPALSYRPSGAGDQPLLPVLVDRSGSMATVDQPYLPDRYTQAVQMLRGQQQAIDAAFEPRWRHFASETGPAESVDDLAELTPSGAGADATDLAGAIRAAAGRTARDRLAGIVLISDGIHNAPSIVRDAAIEAGTPIYTVGVGGETEPAARRRNVRLVSVDAPLEAVVNNVTTVTARVRISDYQNVPVELRLEEPGGGSEPVAATPSAAEPTETLSVPLKWTPRGGGATAASPVRTLKLHAPPKPGEASTDDNAIELHVLMTNPKVRVLYVAGSIRPEYKFLRRLLATDPNIRLISLVRVQENRFWSNGRIAGRTLEKLPETEADFALFDVILLSDLDRTFWSDAQLARLRTFASDGGGLLMIGGHSSFGPGGYGGAPVEDALPVVCGPRNMPQEKTAFVPQLTADGEIHPVFDGIRRFFPAPDRAARDDATLPDLSGCVTVVGPKPAASVLAIHPTRANEAGPKIVLAVQQFGEGRTAALTADSTWRWLMEMQTAAIKSPYPQFWGQLVRWLANVETKSRDTAPAAVLRLDRTHIRAGETVRALARVQDGKGQTPGDAKVSLRIVRRGTDAEGGETQTLAPTLGGGLYRGELAPRTPGEYVVRCTAVGPEGTELGADELPLTVVGQSLEQERLARNDVQLRRISADSDGRYVDLAALPDLIDQIIDRHARPTEARASLLPDYAASYYGWFGFFFVLFVGLLTGEWLLRRHWQLH